MHRALCTRGFGVTVPVLFARLSHVLCVRVLVCCLMRAPFTHLAPSWVTYSSGPSRVTYSSGPSWVTYSSGPSWVTYSSGPSWVTCAAGSASSAALLITTKPSQREPHVSRHAAALA